MSRRYLYAVSEATLGITVFRLVNRVTLHEAYRDVDWEDGHIPTVFSGLAMRDWRAAICSAFRSPLKIFCIVSSAPVVLSIRLIPATARSPIVSVPSSDSPSPIAVKICFALSPVEKSVNELNYNVVVARDAGERIGHWY